MSRKWPEFVNSLHIEEMYLIHKYRSDTRLNFKVNLIVIVANIIQLAEHSFSVAHVYFSETCNKSSSGFEYYVRKQFDYIFLYVDYNLFYGIMLVALDWTAAMIWNFGDIFMVAITTIFTTRFQKLKAKIIWHVESPASIQAISYSENGKSPIQFWREIRVDYNRLSKQCEKLNEVLSDMIVFSFTCNLESEME
nr:unnamed protein product [Callosobruchus chinensis]